MLQLFRGAWILLLASSLTQTSWSDVGVRREVKIVWSLSAAICVQTGVFEKSKKIQQPLKVLAAYKSQEKQLCSHVTRTSCASWAPTEEPPSEEKRGQRTGSNIIVRMKSQQKCGALPLPCNNETGCSAPTSKRAYQVNSVVDSLRSHAKKTQASVLNILKSKSLKSALSIEQLWITNEIVVKGASLGEVQEILEGNNDVAEVRLEQIFDIPEWAPDARNGPGSVTQDNWHIRAVEADRVWAKGVTGKEIIVGHMDGGAFAEHEAIKNNWRGEYGWFDPYLRKTEPYDESGHGTHTLGIAVGQTKRIGAAPGATWMSCKSTSKGGSSDAAFKACAQWMLCPTKADGTEPDCSKAPHVVNNSWGSFIRKDDTNFLFRSEFDEIIRCWRSAGIIPVFAAGNSLFTFCESAYWPALTDNVISVGNIMQESDPHYKYPFRAADTSSRGPPHPSYPQVIKPDVSAPGNWVFSASNSDPQKYVPKSGTSMAAPLVTGTIALMLEKNPSLNYDQVLSALAQSCSKVGLSYIPKPCGNISVEAWPNNHMGFGMINAYKAVFGAGTGGVEC